MNNCDMTWNSNDTMSRLETTTKLNIFPNAVIVQNPPLSPQLPLTLMNELHESIVHKCQNNLIHFNRHFCVYWIFTDLMRRFIINFFLPCLLSPISSHSLAVHEKWRIKRLSGKRQTCAIFDINEQTIK